MRYLVIALSVLLITSIASVASAQVIYTPVKYQYGSGESRYYYGGTDPHVFARAERTSRLLAFQDKALDAPPIYSDLFPWWNARLFGFTRSDARNEAYASVPRYFVKGELLEHAVPSGGVLIVPAQRPASPSTPYPAITPERKPGVIIIIPRPQQHRPPRPKLLMTSAG